MERHATIRTYPRNTVVITEEDEATSAFYGILSGQVKVFLSTKEGKEIVVNMQEAGEHCGELALVDSAPHCASVMTTKKTKLAAISKPDFRKILADHPDIALSLIRDLTGRVRVLKRERQESCAARRLRASREDTPVARARTRGQTRCRRAPYSAGYSQPCRCFPGNNCPHYERPRHRNYISIDHKRIEIQGKLPDRY